MGLVSILVVYFVVVKHSGDDGSLVCVASHSDRHLSWAEMIHAAEIKNTFNTEHPHSISNIRLHKLTVVRSETVEVSDDDLAVLGKKMWPCWWSSCCKRVVVIVDADSLVRGRNPLTKYSTRTSEFLKHSGSTIAPKTTPVKDIPPAAELTSGQNHFELVFTNVEYDSPNDDHNIQLETRGNQATDKVCQGFGDKESQMIRGNFPKFQIVLVGREAACKSTTATWLAHHLKTAESQRNTFTSANKGISFTRIFNMVKLTPTISVADTSGLPDWSFKYLCAIKRLLDGTLVENNRDALTWSENEDKKCKNSWFDVIMKIHLYFLFVSLLVVGSYLWLLGWDFCAASGWVMAANLLRTLRGVGAIDHLALARAPYADARAQPETAQDLLAQAFRVAFLVLCWSGLVTFLFSGSGGKNVNELTCCESQMNQNRDLQAHAILFMVRYGDNEEEVSKFLMKMKTVVKRGSDFNFDMMDRMVFAFSDAPSDDETFKQLVKKLGLPSKDVFPISWSSIGTKNVFIPPDTLLPILKRLQEKACVFFSGEIEAGRVPKPFDWVFWMQVVLVFGVVGVVLFMVPRLRRFLVPRQRRFGVANQVLFIFGLVMTDSLPVPVSPTLLLSHVSTSLPSSEYSPVKYGNRFDHEGFSGIIGGLILGCLAC